MLNQVHGVAKADESIVMNKESIPPQGECEKRSAGCPKT
jgi:hypothetical protein